MKKRYMLITASLLTLVSFQTSALASLTADYEESCERIFSSKGKEAYPELRGYELYTKAVSIGTGHVFGALKKCSTTRVAELTDLLKRNFEALRSLNESNIKSAIAISLSQG